MDITTYLNRGFGGSGMAYESPEQRRRREAAEEERLARSARMAQYRSTIEAGRPMAGPSGAEFAKSKREQELAQEARMAQSQATITQSLAEVPFGAEGQYRPAKPLSEAQLAANNRFAYAKNLEMELGISRAQSQLAMQPLFAGVQRSILGKIGQSVGATPFQPASQYQSPYSSVPYSTSIYGGQSYGWSNPSIVPQFPS